MVNKMNNIVDLTFTQCKQIKINIENGDNSGFDSLREFVEAINNQPDFMSGSMGIDSISEMKAIHCGGCGGKGHPSVFYHEASKHMTEYGDGVLEYIEGVYGEIPPPKKGASWGELASNYLSCAIELWCGRFSGVLDGVDWD